ncbi:MAG TPA: hypothetical protein GX696_09910 [Pseudomonadaceae bacterium]|nr:hypothetical protein [Pseudomonadaceae bacterium]
MRTSLFAKSSLLVIAGVLTTTSVAEAQFLRGLQDRLTDAVERRVAKNVEDRVVGKIEDRAEGMVDSSFESAFQAGSQANGGSGGDDAGSIFSRMLNTSNIEVADRYDFNIAATFEVETLDNRGRSNKDSAMEMVFYYSDNAPYTGTRMTSGPASQQDGSAMIIYDFDNQVMLMLMESEGERFAMPYNWGAMLDEVEAGAWGDMNQEADANMPEFEHIGSRRISGYSSEGYRVRTEGHVTEIWVSDDVAPGIERIFQANRSIPLLGSHMPAGYPQGMLMELNAEDLESGEVVVMRTTDIDMDANVSFRMSEYPILNLGAMMAGGQ